MPNHTGGGYGGDTGIGDTPANENNSSEAPEEEKPVEKKKKNFKNQLANMHAVATQVQDLLMLHYHVISDIETVRQGCSATIAHMLSVTDQAIIDAGGPETLIAKYPDYNGALLDDSETTKKNVMENWEHPFIEKLHTVTKPLLQNNLTFNIAEFNKLVKALEFNTTDPIYEEMQPFFDDYATLKFELYDYTELAGPPEAASKANTATNALRKYVVAVEDVESGKSPYYKTDKSEPHDNGCCYLRLIPPFESPSVTQAVKSLTEARSILLTDTPALEGFSSKIEALKSLIIQLTNQAGLDLAEQWGGHEDIAFGDPNKPPSLLPNNVKQKELQEKDIKEVLEGLEPELTKEDLPADITFKGAKGVSFLPRYNFYLPEYEEATAAFGGSLVEPLLPNLYVYGFYEQIKDKESASWFNKLMMIEEEEEMATGMVGFIQGGGDEEAKADAKEKVFDKEKAAAKKAESAGDAPKKKAETVAKKSIDHFKEWSSNFISTQFGDTGAIQAKFTNIIVPAADMKLFNDLSEQKNMFPMYVEIDFPTDTTTQIAEILKKAKLSKTFMEIVYNSTVLPLTFDLFTEEVRVWDITNWFDDVFETDTAVDVPDDAIILDTGSEANFHKNSLQKTLSLLMLKSKMATILKKPSSELPYSETVFYRVEKRDEFAMPIQNYYLPNSNDIDIITFIDTQVTYDTRYQYAIWKYDLIIQKEENGSVYIILSEKMVSGDTIVRVIDTPPMPPEATFIPYRGINDRLLINLNSSMGGAFLRPIILSDDEFSRMAEVATAQIKARMIKPGDPLRYSTDDPVSSFEVFRTTEKPFSYEDFNGSLIEELTESNSSFVDVLVPNTKYYYMFRSIDSHDHLSNPTAVYEVELVDNAGSTYALIGLCELEVDAKVKLQAQKTAKKHLLIQPSFLQGLPDAEKIPEDASEGAEIAPILGLKPKSVFGRNYKIRLSSKHTGKKIDINISFAHKHTKT